MMVEAVSNDVTQACGIPLTLCVFSLCEFVTHYFKDAVDSCIVWFTIPEML